MHTKQLIRSFLIVFALGFFALSKTLHAEPENIENTEEPAIIQQLADHMTELEAEMAEISKTTNPQIKERLLKNHFQSLKQHTNMLSTMASDFRMMGSKSNKRRMQNRIQLLISNLDQFLQQMQGHYGECELKVEQETEDKQ